MSMWERTIRSGYFSGRVNVAEESDSTGKWLVPVELGDPDGIWERIQVATACRKFPAVKISGPRLDGILGHHLVCVYSPSSRERDVSAILERLREIGVEGPLTYKTDLATVEGRDDKLWTSDQFEAPAADQGQSSSAPKVSESYWPMEPRVTA